MTLLRNWLKAEPHPRRLRAEWEGGAEKTIRVSDANTRWRDAERVLKDCLRVEALDHEDNILRVWESEEPEQQLRNAITKDGKTEITVLAQLLVEAGDLGAQRHAEAYKLSFDSMVMLVKLLSERLIGIERAFHTLLMSQGDGEEPAQLPMNEQMLMQLATLAMARQGQPRMKRPEEANGTPP